MQPLQHLALVLENLQQAASPVRALMEFSVIGRIRCQQDWICHIPIHQNVYLPPEFKVASWSVASTSAVNNASNNEPIVQFCLHSSQLAPRNTSYDGRSATPVICSQTGFCLVKCYLLASPGVPLQISHKMPQESCQFRAKLHLRLQSF